MLVLVLVVDLVAASIAGRCQMPQKNKLTEHQQPAKTCSGLFQTALRKQ